MRKLNRLQEAFNQLRLAQTILTEDYGIGAGEEYGAQQDYREMPQQSQQQQPVSDSEEYEPQAPQQGQEEQVTDMDLSKSDERIAQIREIALDGLQEYAEDVDSEAYQFYKKIWLMCDKAVSEKDSAANGGV